MMDFMNGRRPDLEGHGCGGNQNERRDEQTEREKQLAAQVHEGW
jgi:hypothetical protein